MRNNDNIKLKGLYKIDKRLYPRTIYIFMIIVLSIALYSVIFNSEDFKNRDFYIIILVISLVLVLDIVLFLVNEKHRQTYHKLVHSIYEIYQFISNPTTLSDAEIDEKVSHYAIQLYKMDEKKYTIEEWKSMIIDAIKEGLETN